MSSILTQFIDQLNNKIPMLTEDRVTIANIVKLTKDNSSIHTQVCNLFISQPNYITDKYESHITNTIVNNPDLHQMLKHPRADEIDKILKSKSSDYLYERPCRTAPHVMNKSNISFDGHRYSAGCYSFDNVTSMLNYLDQK